VDVRNSIRQIDFQRLAGISTILGVDVTERQARIVEIQTIGYSFNRSHLNLKPLHFCTVDFPQNTSWSEKGNILKSALTEKGIIAKHAVSSIQTLGVKVVQAVVPQGIRNIDAWLIENQEKLLRLPITSNQIVHTYENLSESENGTTIEISFIRSEDIQNYQTMLQQAGLQLVSLSVGIRDVANIARLINPDKDEVIVEFIRDSRKHSISLHKGHRSEMFHEEFVSVSSISSPADSNVQRILCGDVGVLDSSLFFKPLGLNSEYSLAVGLAIKGFLPDIHPIDVLSPKDQEQFEKVVYKSLFQRVILSMGALILGLLIIQAITEYIISSKQENMEAELLTHSNSYTDIHSLEKQVAELENQASGKGSAVRSSHLAVYMHELALATPEGLWFYRMKEESGAAGIYQFSLSGYTTDEDKITELLKKVTDKGFEASLIRSGNPQQQEVLVPQQGNKKFITFEMKMVRK
jgi:hypothetical protein